MKRFVLDACALIALLLEEAGADKVAAVINAANQGQAEVVMHAINLLEVYYDVYRSRGKEQADFMLEELRKRPVSIHSEIGGAVFIEAGRLKATYKISLADAVALAETIALDGELLTADHHELDVIEEKEPICFHWIR